MVNVFALSVVDGEFDPCRVNPLTIKLVLPVAASSLSTQSKSKTRVAQNKDNMSEWSDLSTRGLLFQWTSTIKIQLRMLV